MLRKGLRSSRNKRSGLPGVSGALRITPFFIGLALGLAVFFGLGWVVGL
jgi:hypothetical protein